MTKAVIIHGNQSIYSHKQMKETIKQTLADKAWARWTALILIASMMFFAYMFVDVMAPLKSLLEPQLGWNSTAYGTYRSSEYILNGCRSCQE